VLFSDAEVARYIDANFEPAWESLRAAPIVTIDFGNGEKVTRTLHGNVATHVCTADGTVIDVLPGVYTPGPYREQLGLIAALAKELAKKPTHDQLKQLADYHQEQAKKLTRPLSPQAAAFLSAQTGGRMTGGFGGFGGFGGGGFKGGFGGFGGQFGVKGGFGGGFGGGGFQSAQPWNGGIEGPLEQVLLGRRPPMSTVAKGELANRPEMILDTEINETMRRRLVHERLASDKAATPESLKKWLFKDVLFVDLDDPKLGLGLVLTANYPFADEDAKAGR
jgi:hypothetical protein